MTAMAAPVATTPCDARRLVATALLGYALLSPLLVRSSVVVCPFRRLTGHYCPLCGLTRSLAAFLAGDIRASLAWHPLGWVVVPAAMKLVLRPRAATPASRADRRRC